MASETTVVGTAVVVVVGPAYLMMGFVQADFLDDSGEPLAAADAFGLHSHCTFVAAWEILLTFVEHQE